MDENEHNLILQMLAQLHDSPNFENLMCFDTSLAWMHSCFTNVFIKQILNQCRKSIDAHYCQNFVIVCQCLATGKGEYELFLEHMQKGLSNISYWSLPIQIEARRILGIIPCTLR